MPSKRKKLLYNPKKSIHSLRFTHGFSEIFVKKRKPGFTMAFRFLNLIALIIAKNCSARNLAWFHCLWLFKLDKLLLSLTQRKRCHFLHLMALAAQHEFRYRLL